jgi:hypothetical protein
MHGKGGEYPPEFAIPAIRTRGRRRKALLIDANLSLAGVAPIFINRHLYTYPIEF